MEAAPALHREDDACVICLSSITERAITVPCNHCMFDFICLVSWLQQRSACPLCNSQITAVQYDWVSPTDFKTYAVQRTSQPTPSIEAGLGYSRHELPRRSRTIHRSYEQPQPDIAVLRRRHIYRNKLYSLHVGSNPFSGYQDVLPEVFASSAELQSRARAWIRRELRVFAFLQAEPEAALSNSGTTSSNAEFLLSYIVAILKKVDLKASNGHAEDLLQEFLGRDNARLFLHELNAWIRSPYSRLGLWDRNVQYEEELPTRFDEIGLAEGRVKAAQAAPNE
ncbi:hypothetical protein K458DRAFT_16216 [Lentithecium fluviatile CBS 122367]|uniref:RING-type E3 ubiquitin transferase n=1 Tax=Lentithecium fluviatile CBS 122367 TaxID=1168545 RepID=A0A6G1J6F3_9PLEO|nr:hypothetical protein K458DRAFT_16216 [Lentithecium fluviatile CBS 122367]